MNRWILGPMLVAMLTGPAFAAQHVTVTQHNAINASVVGIIGNGSTVSVTQTGLINGSVVGQIGVHETATVNQVGTHNSSGISQGN